MGVLVRTCKGRKDYCGGRNNYLPVSLLLSNPEAFAAKVASIVKMETRIVEGWRTETL